MNAVVAVLAGVLFAVGLALSGMTQPKAVIGFLDFFGRWNPSLAFVMVGAIGVYALGRRLVLKRPAPLYDTTFHPPLPAPVFAPRLIGGSALFGGGSPATARDRAWSRWEPARPRPSSSSARWSSAP